MIKNNYIHRWRDKQRNDLVMQQYEQEQLLFKAQNFDSWFMFWPYVPVMYVFALQ